MTTAEGGITNILGSGHILMSSLACSALHSDLEAGAKRKLTLTRLAEDRSEEVSRKGKQSWSFTNQFVLMTNANIFRGFAFYLGSPDVTHSKFIFQRESHE